MSKPNRPTEVKAYSVIRRNSGFQIVETVIVDAKIKSTREIGTEDVFAVIHAKLSKLIRDSLGM